MQLRSKKMSKKRPVSLSLQALARELQTGNLAAIPKELQINLETVTLSDFQALLELIRSVLWAKSDENPT